MYQAAHLRNILFIKKKKPTNRKIAIDDRWFPHSMIFSYLFSSNLSSRKVATTVARSREQAKTVQTS